MYKLHFYLLEANTLFIKLIIMTFYRFLAYHQGCFQQGYHQGERWVWEGNLASCYKAWIALPKTWGYDNICCSLSTILSYETTTCKKIIFTLIWLFWRQSFCTRWKVGDGGKVVLTFFLLTTLICICLFSKWQWFINLRQSYTKNRTKPNY